MKLAIHNQKPVIANKIVDEWIDMNVTDITKVSDYLMKYPISVISGGILDQFEAKYAEMFEAKYAVAFCNGTAALHAASFACGANISSNFILSAYSYHGTVNSLLENSSRAYLCDYDPNTLNLDCNSVEQLIDNETKGIIISHTWGNPAEMDKIYQLKQKHKISIISDASHAHGAEWSNKKIGGLDMEDISCFSLGKNKLISGGELGIATTNSAELYDALLFIGHPNRVPGCYLTNKYEQYPNSIGNKYRPHPLSMVIALNQLIRFSDKINLNIQTNSFLSSEINKIPGFKTINVHSNSKRVYWKFTVKIVEEYWEEVSFETIIRALECEGLSLEQFHNYDIEKNLQLWNFTRYDNQVSNKTINDLKNDLIILPGYISLDIKTMRLIVNCFAKVSENKKELKLLNRY